MGRRQTSRDLRSRNSESWWNNVAYPVFIFIALYLLVVAETTLNACLNSDFHVNMLWASVQTGLSCMLVASLAFVFGRWVKVLHIGLVGVMAYVLALDLVEMYVRRHFHDEVVGDGCAWLMVLSNSSLGEVVEFLSENVFAGEYVVLMIYIVSFLAVVLVIARMEVARPCVKSLLCCLACCFAFIIGFSPPFPYEDRFSQSLFSARKLGFFQEFTGGFTFGSLAQIGRRMPPSRRYVAESHSDSPFGLVVFGESATRHHWSLYGYPRLTTPRLELLTDEIVVFSSVRASYWLTIQAMISMLTGKCYKDANDCCTLPSIIKGVGLTSSFCSGQSHWGHWDGADALLFSLCDKKSYLADSHVAGSYWDYDLLPGLKADIANEGVNVCFVHLMGSHFDFSKRYPPDFLIFSDETEDEISKANPLCRGRIASYDNSIAYTDRLLGELIDEVRKLRACAFVLYVSDHGETPETSDRDLTQDGLWDVPMVVWLSEGYRQSYPDVVELLERRKDEDMTNAEVFEVVLCLMRIRQSRSGD